jgi:oxygen-independent coproporphyrinogen-3 oxidase
MENSALIEKYDVRVPRYTSYPSIPLWNSESFRLEDWQAEIQKTFQEENGLLSLYLHLPFCEKLCTYCGCNKRITVNHGVEEPYIKALLSEWKMYRDLLNTRPMLNELHLGGGTPTFFSAENLKYLIGTLLESVNVPAEHEYSLEVHPNYTQKKQLEVLATLGFNRLSMGVQDFDEKVQRAIHRIQTVKQTEQCNDNARALGYSVNMDMVFGLPFQTLNAIKHTMDEVIRMRPDRIAFYSYAHVPWKSAAQRGYNDSDLPQKEEKMMLYETGKAMLLAAGYESIGMDHFALPNDPLLLALKNGKLNRNFMGYTTNNNRLQLALGVSAIADCWTMFAQNNKTVEEYENEVAAGKFPLLKGHHLTPAEIKIRRHITNLICNYQTHWDASENEFMHPLLANLQELINDKLVVVSDTAITTTETGKPFIRNICAAIDPMLQNVSGQNMFSLSV